MKKVMLLFMLVAVSSHAGIMDSVANIVKSTLSDDSDNNEEIRSVGTVMTIKNTHKDKQDSLLDSVVDSVKDTIGTTHKKKEKSSILTDGLTSIKKVSGLHDAKKDNNFFDNGIMQYMSGMISLEKGETLGLPSVFGFNKKKETKVFGSRLLGKSALGDIKDTSTAFYRGFRNTGESAEFMSGMMYRSSKIYNGMFEIFDDSPFNIFDDKKNKEPSVFDVFDKGNDVLDVFD